MNSKTQYDRYGVLSVSTKLYFESVNPNRIQIKCVECMKKDDDQVAAVLKKGGEWCEYFVYQCEETKNEINSNPLDYKGAMCTLMEWINVKNKSHHD